MRGGPLYFIATGAPGNRDWYPAVIAAAMSTVIYTYSNPWLLLLTIMCFVVANGCESARTEAITATINAMP